jgi:hypothetical protein
VVPGDGVDAERVRKTVFEMRLKHDVELASNEIPQLLIHKQIEVRKPNDKGVMQTNKNRVEGVMLLPPEVIKRCTPEPVVAEQLHRKLWWFSGVKVNHEVIPGAWHVKMQFNRRVKLTNSEVREGGTFSSIFAREAVAKAREYIIGFDTEAEARCAAEVLDNLRYYQVRKSDDKSGEAVR